MGLSVLHIKSEVECHVYLFDEEKGIAHAGTYFNLDVRKGEQDLLFVSVDDETVRYRLLYDVAENDSDYRITITKSQFKYYSPDILAEINKAEQGDSQAQFYIGERYYYGYDIEENHEEAVKWYRKAAEHGDAIAQFNLGYCYENGDGVEQNYEEAVKWYRKAAEQGHANAQNNLGVCYEYGDGVEQNYEEAVKWILKAAEHGHANAQKNLGVCYKNGVGVEKNYEEAFKWYRKAEIFGVQVVLGSGYSHYFRMSCYIVQVFCTVVCLCYYPVVAHYYCTYWHFVLDFGFFCLGKSHPHIFFVIHNVTKIRKFKKTKK